MQTKRAGRQTVQLSHPPSVVSFANIGGRMEGQGPLSDYFDELSPEHLLLGKRHGNRENPPCRSGSCAERWKRRGLTAGELDYVLAGDLLNQCIGTSFGLRSFHIPFYGLYGACSTMGESLSLAALLIDGGFARLAAAMTSSHYLHRRAPVPDAGPLRQPAHPHRPVDGHRLRLLYSGRSRGTAPISPTSPAAASWTGASPTPTTWGPPWPPPPTTPCGRTSLLPATGPEDYDLIVTGDLGLLGQQIVTDLFRQDGVDMTKNYTDCGLLLYHLEKQDMHAGGSGCGCSAAVFNGYLLRGLREGRWKRLLFAPTGALLSPTSSFQGESIPGICHAVALSAAKEGV